MAKGIKITLAIGPQKIGLFIILLSFLLFYFIFTFTQDVMALHQTQCGCGEVCPMAENLPLSSYLGFSLVVLMMILGIYLVLAVKETEVTASKKIKEWNKVLKTLPEDSAQLYTLIKDSEGVIFQADLVKQSSMNKVKVSRLLDKMEAKGLLERRRKGMANIILLKNP
jgi:uncharacterized membrane protein